MKKFIIFSILILQGVLVLAGEAIIQPDQTYLFAKKDTTSLFMDVYNPKVTEVEKPTIIFMFGGGFIFGNRADKTYQPWFKAMTERGYRIISIDYRLGLKGVKGVGIGQVNAINNAIHLAVEDLYSATNYIIENAEGLGVDPKNITIAGSSAGAISVLQAEYELCNKSEVANVLPADFRYNGVVSFAGAILSFDGKLKYAKTPAPTLLLHGTKDKVVKYTQIRLFNIGFFGSDRIAERFAKFNYNYSIYRYFEHEHEIANSMVETLDEQLIFLSKNVIQKKKYIVDATVMNPNIDKGTTVGSLDDLYGN